MQTATACLSSRKCLKCRFQIAPRREPELVCQLTRTCRLVERVEAGAETSTLYMNDSEATTINRVPKSSTEGLRRGFVALASLALVLTLTGPCRAQVENVEPVNGEV